MPLYVYLAASAITASIGLAWWGLSGPRTRDAVQENLGHGLDLRNDYRDIQLSRSGVERFVEPVTRVLERGIRRLMPSGVIGATTRRVELAGLREKWPVERLMAAKLGGTSLVILLGAVRVAGGNLDGPTLVAIALLTVAAYLTPDAVISRLASRRQRRLQVELSDSIDQITMSVEAGLGIDAALARAARSRHGIVGHELTRVLQDIQVGLSRDQALDRLLERTDVADLRHVVLGLRQAELYGIPIADFLRVQAAELRDKRRALAEERAMKIPVKVVFPLVFCILPALFIVVLGPAALQIADQLG
jgi:tight adherence protein C